MAFLIKFVICHWETEGSIPTLANKADCHNFGNESEIKL